MRTEEEILKQSKTVAVVGLSATPERPSNQVSRHLQRWGYRVIPVNPSAQELVGEKSYPDLASIPDPVDIVVIFRRSEDVPPLVEDAIQKGAKVVWMPERVVNEEAAARARAAGLDVVMDRCMHCSALELGLFPE